MKMGCVVCEKIREKKAVFIYEDDLVAAILPAKPAALGHIKVYPKAHAEKLDGLPDDVVERIMLLASFSSAAAFDVLHAHGTNIILNESDAHLAFDVMPRKENDGLDFSWKPREGNPSDLDAIHSKIADKAFGIGKNEKKPDVIELPQPDEKKAPAPNAKPADPREEPDNYQVKNLERIP